jgi:hypothetical protein
MSFSLADLINYSSAENPIEFGQAFTHLINNKIEVAIDNKKIEVAHKIIGNREEPEEPEEIEGQKDE